MFDHSRHSSFHVCFLPFFKKLLVEKMWGRVFVRVDYKKRSIHRAKICQLLISSFIHFTENDRRQISPALILFSSIDQYQSSDWLIFRFIFSSNFFDFHSSFSSLLSNDCLSLRAMFLGYKKIGFFRYLYLLSTFGEFILSFRWNHKKRKSWTGVATILQRKSNRWCERNRGNRENHR